MLEKRESQESEARGVRVNAEVVIPRSELVMRATRSGGPGGQHVNTSSTRVEIVWNVRTSAALDDAARSRTEHALMSRLDSDGNIRVVASDTRSQRQNRELAEQRLAETLRRALIIRKARKRTRPHRGAVEARLADKKRRSETKQERRFQEED